MGERHKNRILQTAQGIKRNNRRIPSRLRATLYYAVWIGLVVSSLGGEKRCADTGIITYLGPFDAAWEFVLERCVCVTASASNIVLSGGQIDGRGGVLPIAYGAGGVGGSGAPRWGAGFKKALKEDFNHTMSLNIFSTSLPLETNNVTLDPELKDSWGLPAIRVTYKEHPDDMKTKAFLRERCIEIMEASGALTKTAPPVAEARSGHLMGTCRMGTDPKSSVVDRFNHAHDVPNLFIVDGSSFVTSARNHPTCTIEALAFRAAEQMIRLAKKGDLKTSASPTFSAMRK